MKLPYKKYNFYKSSISYKDLETEDFQTIYLKKKKFYSENEIEDLLKEHEIVFDKETNKFVYDKEKIEFIQSDITEQLGLTNDSEIDLNKKEYLDFYINDTFIEKINLTEFIKFKVDFTNETEEIKELTFSFYEENSDSLFEFSNYHLIEFVIS